jgi:glutathione S-transferase
MADAKPRFITFGISHFCEKARWALDWHSIAYEEAGWPPGLHQILAKRCGASSSTLPMLFDGTTIIQGSGAVIDWAESKDRDSGRSLVPRGGAKEAEEIERRADAVIGVHVRRLAFAEMLPHYPHLLKPALFQRASPWHRLLGNMMWPVSRQVMLRRLDIRPGAAAESRAMLEGELDWLDAKLADGRTYLAGERFSRADLTVASLLATFARPKEMPLYHALRGPEAISEDVRRWSERPVMRFVREQYGKHRANANAASE